jgi:hypothetical protein
VREKIAKKLLQISNDCDNSEVDSMWNFWTNHIKDCPNDNRNGYQSTVDYWLNQADQILSLSTDTERIAIVRKEPELIDTHCGNEECFACNLRKRGRQDMLEARFVQEVK